MKRDAKEAYLLLQRSLKKVRKAAIEAKKTSSSGCFSKQCTSEMSRALQTSTVYFSRVSYLFECNANDTYVLRMTQNLVKRLHHRKLHQKQFQRPGLLHLPQVGLTDEEEEEEPVSPTGDPQGAREG